MYASRISVALAVLLALVPLGCPSDDDPAATDAATDAAPVSDGSVISTISLDELVGACIGASACGVKTYPILANCVDAYFDLFLPQGLGPVYDAIYRCVYEAKGDCTTIKACYDERGACDNTYIANCDGTTAIACDLIDKKVYALKCDLAQLECQVRSGQTTAASCTPGVCYSTFGTVCQGSWLVSCVGGVSEVEDCVVQGLVCKSSSATTAACVGEQAVGCSQKFSPSCQDDTAITCVGGKEHHDDCTRHVMRHTRCSGAQCVAAGTACEHSFNRCSGAQLEACFDGEWKQYDCAKLGLGPCETLASGANCGK